MRLHLAKDILMIQEQDVICVSGEPFYSGVSSSYFSFKMRLVQSKNAQGVCVHGYSRGLRAHLVLLPLGVF